MPTSHVAQFALGLVVGVCIFAWWKGNLPERLAALIIMLNSVIFIAGGYLAPSSMQPVLLLADDALTAVGLLAITMRYGSLWLGGAMLLYAAQFTLHSFYFVTDRPTDVFHAYANNIDFLGVILCLAVGTIVAMRRRAAERRAG